MTRRIIGTIFKESIGLLGEAGTTLVHTPYLGKNVNMEQMIDLLAEGADGTIVGEDPMPG